jgi:hypothetical protein
MVLKPLPAGALESDSDLELAEADLANMPSDRKQRKCGQLKLIVAQFSRVEIHMMSAEQTRHTRRKIKGDATQISAAPIVNARQARL